MEKIESGETKKSESVAMYPSFKERVIEAANKDGRSFSDYICRAVEKELKRNKG